jgi:hypothetical protein
MRRGLAVLALVAATGLGACGGTSRPAKTAAAPSAYAGPGFELSIPSGWRLAARSAIAGGPTVSSYRPANQRASLIVHYFPHPTETVAQAIADDVESDTVEAQTYSRFRVLRRTLHTGSITGARQSAELVETYLDPGGTSRSDDLVVLMPSGSMVDVEVVASARYAGYDPATTTGSFRLVSSG